VEANKQGVAQNQAGVAANAATNSTQSAQIQAAQQRFDNLTEWDVKKDVTINFDTGKSDLSADAKQQLTAVAKEAQG
jgi:outer membrane protein OmpA-like peptidoglycan-associated protein